MPLHLYYFSRALHHASLKHAALNHQFHEPRWMHEREYTNQAITSCCIQRACLALGCDNFPADGQTPRLVNGVALHLQHHEANALLSLLPIQTLTHSRKVCFDILCSQLILPSKSRSSQGNKLHGNFLCLCAPVTLPSAPARKATVQFPDENSECDHDVIDFPTASMNSQGTAVHRTSMNEDSKSMTCCINMSALGSTPELTLRSLSRAAIPGWSFEVEKALSVLATLRNCSQAPVKQLEMHEPSVYQPAIEESSAKCWNYLRSSFQCSKHLPGQTSWQK